MKTITDARMIRRYTGPDWIVTPHYRLDDADLESLNESLAEGDASLDVLDTDLIGWNAEDIIRITDEKYGIVCDYLVSYAPDGES